MRDAAGDTRPQRKSTRDERAEPMQSGYVSPAVSIGWTGLHINPAAYDLLESAWQELFREPAWSAWMTANRDELYADPGMYLSVEQRADIRSSRRKDICLYVPESTFDDTAGIRTASRAILRQIYQIRADHTGMAEPPPV